MADNFSANHIQGIFGVFKPVTDDTVDQSVDNYQGVFGRFVPVLDEAAGAVAVSRSLVPPRRLNILLRR